MKSNQSKQALWLGSLIFLLFFSNSLLLADAKHPEITADDHLVVVKNHDLIFDVIKKRIQQKSIKDINIISPPEFGKIQINSFDSLTYIPNPDICEEKDEFVYMIKTEQGYDTISVFVEILCESLTIISGFTPDGDGINDTFTILGVQNYPDNSLIIFNKWGEQIFYKKGYQNDWKGEQDSGDSLASEDSVYYYVFDNGEGKILSGYLQIMETI